MTSPESPDVDIPRPRDARRHPALTDGPTGLPNALHFDVIFRVAFWFGHRGIPVSLLLMELPAMKDASPENARELGRRMGIVTRRTDLMARVEDDRLAALLLDCNVHGGLIAAERFSGELEAWAQMQPGAFRAGLASYHQEMGDPADLMVAAEKALEAARGSGESGHIEVYSR